MGSRIEEKLGIVIITYNRSKLLSNTLEALLDSPFKDCSIKILNNCSTDNTLAICESYKKLYVSMEVITNKFNIGGDANILRACEVADKEYLWILADDDQYDFSYCDDVIQHICEGDIDLIHVGAHTHLEWSYGGSVAGAKDLANEGYTFFFFSSFLPCNIFKVKTIYPFIIDGYKNICNMYPHMPYLLSYYSDNKSIYVSDCRIVKAVGGNQQYSDYDFISGWLNTSYLLKNKKDISKCFFEQFGHYRQFELFYIYLYATVFHDYLSMGVMSKIWRSFNLKEKINCIVYVIPHTIKKIKKRSLRLLKKTDK